MAKRASSGHKLGQLVGDWFEEHFVLPLLRGVGTDLDLFLDTRFVSREARGDKLLWKDEDDNEVDYDFVLELGGTPTVLGVPVGFVECFWRRGKRHSKDKARDDSGKLAPMRQVYPAARFLGVIAGGDFTAPAADLVRNRGIDLFIVPKSKIIDAFNQCGIAIDYDDILTESKKARIAKECEKGIAKDRCKEQVAENLRNLVGEEVIAGYTDRVRASLSSLPQEVRLSARRNSRAVVFESVEEVSFFLNDPKFEFHNSTDGYIYHCLYSDGTEFDREVASIEELRFLHNSVEQLVTHLRKLRSK